MLLKWLVQADRRPACARRVRVAGQIPLRYPACDQLTSRSATSSRAGRRPASEQDSIMEYALNRSANQLASWFASWSATC